MEGFDLSTIQGCYVGSTPASAIYMGSNLIWPTGPHDYSKDYLTFVAKESGTFTFTPQNSNIISYSTDNGESWITGNSVTVESGDKVLWKGTMTSSAFNYIGTFSSTAIFDVQGNVMSLLFGDDFNGKFDLTGKDYAFYELFYDNAKLVSAENLSLPATTLAQDCYGVMFDGCTNLINAPELPATTLAQGCYSHMFEGCTSLVTAPELPATTLVIYCYYNMFTGCTSLVTAPDLPATTLAEYCYQSMFQGCTKLINAPELPATTLVRSCYQYMFEGCTSLNYINAMFTTTPSNFYTNDWVQNVAATGTFVKNANATWTDRGTYAVPTGWTIEQKNI